MLFVPHARNVAPAAGSSGRSAAHVPAGPATRRFTARARPPSDYLPDATVYPSAEHQVADVGLHLEFRSR